MTELEKLADILHAKAFQLTIDTQKIIALTPISDSKKHTLQQLIKKSDIENDSTYQSFSYHLGHFLLVRTYINIAVLFWFDYSDSFTRFNELLLVSTLTNLKSIAQIIYTLKTSRSAPDETLHLQHISKVDQNGMIIKFGSAAYYKVEKDIIQAIIYSHQNDLINALERISQINLFNVQNDSYTTSRLEKNYLISYIAILNRAVIQWGYPVSLAFKVHHELMKELESIKKIPTFSQVLQGITWYYFQTIKEYRTTNFLPLHLRIKSYINEHIGENITLNDIASALHASKKTLNPAFKKEYKLTITQFIRQRKIAVAKELLIACESSTIEISELLSFSSQSYFIKTFKDLTGTTPQYFREHFFDQHLHL